jgi:hypothetical protein
MRWKKRKRSEEEEERESSHLWRRHRTLGFTVSLGGCHHHLRSSSVISRSSSVISVVQCVSGSLAALEKRCVHKGVGVLTVIVTAAVVVGLGALQRSRRVASQLSVGCESSMCEREGGINIYEE